METYFVKVKLWPSTLLRHERYQIWHKNINKNLTEWAISIIIIQKIIRIKMWSPCQQLLWHTFFRCNGLFVSKASKFHRVLTTEWSLRDTTRHYPVSFSYDVVKLSNEGERMGKLFSRITTFEAFWIGFQLLKLVNSTYRTRF